MYPLQSNALTLAYENNNIIEGLDLNIPLHSITVLVGSNGCGKSTLVKSFARLLRPKQGMILLNGKDIHQQATARVAKKLSILPQSPLVPEGLTVYQVVRMGRYPHQNWLKRWPSEDQLKVNEALQQTQSLS